MTEFSDIIIVCGHYGSGKTNLSLNLAFDFASRGEKVTLADLDIVNPYFRSSDYPELLEQHGIELIAPMYAHSNVDIPSLPASMYSLTSRGGRVIIDVGGDDSGATALGRFSAMLSAHGYDMLYVVNKYRALSTTCGETVELLGEIETASRLKATAVVNNSHIMQLTTAQDVLESDAYARKVSELSGLPLVMTAVDRRLAGELDGKISDIYPVDIHVTTPWQR